MAEIVAIEVEARLLRWGDSSTAGRTITLELDPDAGERHPFRDYASGAKNGQRFRLLFAPIGDDEEPLKAGPVSEQAPARSLPQTAPDRTLAENARVAKPRNPDAADRARAAYKADTKEGQAARKAGIMCGQDREFQDWALSQCNHYPVDDPKQRELLVADIVRSWIGGRRAMIATDPEIYEQWDRVKLAFEQATGRAARPS